MSVCDVIIMGVGGRMGSALASLVQDDPAFRLAGAVASPRSEAALARFGCMKGTSMEDVFAKCPGAVIIDFTSPETSLKVAGLAARLGNPAVIGTTGFSPEQQRELEASAAHGRIFWDHNMSLGINVLAKMLPALTEALGPGYDIEILEIHHNRKADSPSGTALKLGQAVSASRGEKLEDVRVSARDGLIGARAPREIGIMALRGGDVVGDHTVYFLGPGERIEVTHRAHSRETLARGALRAALWIRGQKPGRLHSMADMLA
ncbi:MAG: 4-hydroxy-tetrahydrodipicolinate reductase [Thermodesulfobacteriota bacterium]